jgi:ketosteroid isomerase-like protein
MFVLAGAALAALIAVTVVGCTRGSEPRGDAVDTLRAIEQARLHALVAADTGTAGNIMAVDFELVNPAGSKMGRDEYLDAIKDGAIDYHVFQPSSPIDVHRSGDAAVLRFPFSVDLTADGTRLAHVGWITELYERRNGRWQIVWEQATAVPNNFNLFAESLKPTT